MSLSWLQCGSAVSIIQRSHVFCNIIDMFIKKLSLYYSDVHIGKETILDLIKDIRL